MSKKSRQLQIEIQYSFDRFHEQKLAQAFQLLVPQKNGKKLKAINNRKEINNENSCNLHQSFISETKGRKNYLINLLNSYSSATASAASRLTFDP